MLPVSGTDRFTCLSGCTELAHAGATKLEQLHTQREQEFALKLPGLDRGRQAVHADAPEKQVQQRIFDFWTHLRRSVLSTVHRYRIQTCEKCGNTFWPRGGYRASKGIGDLLIPIEVRPGLVLWRMQDVKARTGKPEPEQAQLAAIGALIFVRNPAESKADIDHVEEQIHGC